MHSYATVDTIPSSQGSLDPVPSRSQGTAAGVVATQTSWQRPFASGGVQGVYVYIHPARSFR